MFQAIFNIVRSELRAGSLSQEPDFQTILKKPQNTCLVGVFWVFQGILA